MEIQSIRMISSSLVFLLRQHLTTIELEREDLERLLTPHVSVAQTPDGRFVFTSVADQIEVIAGVNRVDIRDLSRQAPRPEQIAAVAKGILTALKADARAYGINYEFESCVPNGKSGDYLLRTFARHDLGNYVQGLRGAALTLFFDLDDRRLRAVIEPRWMKLEEGRIFVNVNVHKDLETNEQTPGEQQLAGEIKTYFERVRAILSGVPTWREP